MEGLPARAALLCFPRQIEIRSQADVAGRAPA